MVLAVLLILLALGLFSGCACGQRCGRRSRVRPAPGGATLRRGPRWGVALFGGAGLALFGALGVIWNFAAPPLASRRIAAPPPSTLNDPARSLVLGNGCFWHTQYDAVVVEQDAAGPFNRSDETVTALVGYAGGVYESPRRTACYGGTVYDDYAKLGHAEAVSVEIDAGGATASAQVRALLDAYFEHGFKGRRRGRLDPQDAGPEYRNVIALPGGVRGAWWPLVRAANVYDMKLRRGRGGPARDLDDNHVVYVYDSREFPFYRAEGYHQFHRNLVIQRHVPRTYHEGLKRVQEALGRLDGHGCADPPYVALNFLFPAAFGFALGAGAVLLARARAGLRGEAGDRASARKDIPPVSLLG